MNDKKAANPKKSEDDLKQFKFFGRFSILQSLLVLALVGIIATIIYELLV